MAKKKMLYLQQQIDEIKHNFFRRNGCEEDVSVKDFFNGLLDLDLQQFGARYKWKGLPDYLPENIIERMLYFRGSVVGFFHNGELKFLPYAIVGDLNDYAYPTKVRPVSYNGKVYNNIELNTYPNGSENKNATGVILYDRIPLLNGNGCLPRAVISRDIIDLQNDTLQRSEINSINSLKKLGYTVANSNQKETTRKAVKEAMMDKSPVIITTKDGLSDANETFSTSIDNETDKIMQYFSALNNYRCYTMGIKNNGMFEKMERIATGELTGNEYQTNLLLDTGLTCRKNFLNSLKKIYPEYKSILDKITVEINVDPYKPKAEGDIENKVWGNERDGSTKVGVEND